jgi:hypothetical protein
MSLDRARLETLKHALKIIGNTLISVSHIIGTFGYRTANEIADIVQYSADIISSLVTVLRWNVEQPVYIYERPAQLLTVHLEQKLNQAVTTLGSATNHSRLLVLAELKHDLMSIQTVLRIGLNNANIEWRRAQSS